MNNNSVLSIIVPCYNEEKVLNETKNRLLKVLVNLIAKEKISRSSFIVFIDDGSSDNTWNIIEAFSNSKYIKGIKLTRNQGHQNAILAGMEFVQDRCDCLVSIDADLQQDETKIEEFIDKYQSGGDVVLGVRKNRDNDSFFKKNTALVFYKFMKIIGVDIVQNHADYRLLSKQANKSLLQFKEVNLFLRGLIPLIGFNTKYVYFKRRKRYLGKSKYTLRKMITLSINGITSFSTFPLKIITFLGFSIFLFSIFFSLFILYVKIFTNNTIPGWSSTVLPIYFIGGIQLLSLGIIGEYIGKIYKETKKRPRYIIEKVID